MTRITDSSTSTGSDRPPSSRAQRLPTHDGRGSGADERFLILQGIETVALRMARHVENARAVASLLRADPRVASLDFVGFPDSPYHGLARNYLGGRAPSLFTFGVVGGRESAEAFYDALKLVKRVVNIGDTRSLAVTRPRRRTGK
jgi:O-acetylhomoserine/O-acetylserine sulfhydrylase-like pyridoxal-dependent enzyme